MKNRHIRHPSNEPENYESLMFRGIYSPNPNPPNSKKSMLHLFASTLQKKRCPNLPAQKSFHVWDKKNIQKSSLTQQGVSTIVSKLLRLIGGVGNPAKTAASSFVFSVHKNPMDWRFQPVLKHIPSFQGNK